jgi:hypothetical protein
MKLTKEWLKEKYACSDGFNWFTKQKETNSTKVLKTLIEQEKLDWANWLIVRVMTRPQYLAYAIYAAEQVIDIYEKRNPCNDKPRKAIDAAKAVLANDTKENRAATAAAATAAADAYADAAAAYAATAAAAAAAAVYAAAAAAYAATAAAYADAADAYAAAAAAATATAAADAYADAAAAYAAADAAAAAAYTDAAAAAAAAYTDAAAAADARNKMKLKILEYGLKLLGQKEEERG